MTRNPGDGRAADPARRPGVVTAAVSLMIILAVAAIAEVAAGASQIPSLPDSTAISPGDLEILERFKAVVVAVAIGFLLIGLGILGLSVAILRGGNWARFATIGVYIVFILCAAVVAMGIVGLDESLTSMNNGEISPSDLGFYSVAAAVFGSQVLGMTATIGLLILPPANRWFKAHSARRNHAVPR